MMSKNRVFFLWVILIICMFVCVNSLIYYNPSKSMPIGYYIRTINSTFKVNDDVLICVTDLKQQYILYSLGLKHENSQCPRNFPFLLKRIFAKENDLIVVTTLGIKINNKLIVNSVILDHYNFHKLPSLLKFKKYKLRKDEYLVLGLTQHSYDSRYFGIINKKQIYSRVILL